MNAAQAKKIEDLQQDYVVTVIEDNEVDRVTVRASNGIMYRIYIIGPRGGITQQGQGMEKGGDLLKIIEQ